MKPDNTPEALLTLARQFMECRILLSAAEMDLFTLLDAGPSTAEDLAGKLHADLRGLAILLDALAAMGLLSKEEGVYRSAPEAALFLTEGNPRSVLPMVLHAAHLWESWSNLTRVVQGDGSTDAPAPPARDRQGQGLEAFIGAMHVAGMRLARKIVADIQPGPARNLIDVGGASGTYTIAFLQAVPNMQATLFDIPTVIPLARKRLNEEGLLDRVRLVGGNFYTDELPGGHDLALLSAVIHQNGPQDNVALFRKAFRAMVPGGRILIRDHVMAPGRIRPKDGAIFAVNMLVNTAGGSTYTFEEIRNWLAEAGFHHARLLRVGERMDALVDAFKPG